MNEKLQKLLSRAGYGSRRSAETLISEGRVKVNGQIATLGDRVDVSQPVKISVDGRLLAPSKLVSLRCRVLLYYKPEGEICTRQDPQGRPTVFNALPRLPVGNWIAVGRLDINTSGLLLFTTDGELANRLMHPKYQMERVYAVRVFGRVEPEKLAQLKEGIPLEEGLAAFNDVSFIGGSGMNQWYHVTLTEGRYREVRRLWEAVDVKVSRLIRIKYAQIDLPDDLHRGQYLALDNDAVDKLLIEVGLPTQSIERSHEKKEDRPIKTTQRSKGKKYPESGKYKKRNFSSPVRQKPKPKSLSR